MAEATPEPPSEADAVSVNAAVLSVSPSSGAVSEPLGAVLSMRTVRVALVPVLPLASLESARRS